VVVPIHWWKLDETSGPLADSGTPGGSPGTATGTTSVPGLFTRARSFATSEVIDCGNPADLNFAGAPFSIGSWIYRSSAPADNRYFIAKDASGARSYALGVTSASQLIIVLNSVADVMTVAYVPYKIVWGMLHHVVLTRFATTYKVYVNSILVHTFTGPASIKTVTTPFVIGNNGNGYGTYYFGGVVDNVMVWDRALTAYEVQDYYYRGASAIFLSNLTPDVYATRINTTTTVAFSIECSIDIDSNFTIEVDENGTNTWVTAYNGASWVPPYSGTITGSSTKIDIVISSRTYPVNSPVNIRVVAQNIEEEEYTLTYWFRTVVVSDQITPRYPLSGEQLVSTGTSIAIDFRDEDPTTIVVNSILVYDASLIPVFRNGWTGSYIDDDVGQRIILVPPAPLTLDTNYTVVANTATATKTYAFRVGSQQVTTTNDAVAPRVTEATSAQTWIGYIRNGKLYLRHADPLGGAAEVVPTEHFEHGYDPTLGKYILYWIDRGKIYYATADPADTPETLVPPNDALSEVRMGVGDDRPSVLGSLQEDIQAPFVRGVPPDGQLIVDALRPTGDPETVAIVAFQFYKFVAGTYQLVAEVPVAPGDVITSYEDPDYLPGIEYAVRPVYASTYAKRIEGPMSPRGAIPTYSGTVSVGVGSDCPAMLSSVSIVPSVYFFPETLKLAPGDDKPGTLTYKVYVLELILPDVEAVKIAVGDDHPGTLKGTGFGIIGVG